MTARDEAVDVRLVPAAAAVWVAAGAAVRLPAVALAATGVVAAALAAGCLVRVRRRPSPRSRAWAAGQAVLALGAVAVLLLATAGQARGRESGGLRELAADGAAVRLVGVVRSTPQALGGGDDGAGATVRFLLAARELREDRREPGHPSPSTVRTRAAVDVLAPASAAGLAYGTEVEVRVRLAPVPDRGARAVARARTTGDVTVRSRPPPLLRATEALRAGLVTTAAGVPGDAGRLLPGVAVGDVRGVGDLDAAMRVSGLAHLTAVSGAHFSLLGGVVLALAVRCRVPRRARWLPVAVVMGGFVAVVHPGASVVRAAVMGAVGVLGLVAGRPARTVPALAAAVVVLLVVDPWLAGDIGFVLSVVATAGIALLAGPLARGWTPRVDHVGGAAARTGPRAREGAGGRSGTGPGAGAGAGRPGPGPPGTASALATALAVPVAAQAVCAPVVLLLSPAVPLYAVPANVLVAPAVAPATVGGLLAALLGGWWPAAATWCAQVAGAGCWWIAAVARAAAGLPGAQVAWVGGPVGPLLLAGASAAALVLVLRCRQGVAP